MIDFSVSMCVYKDDDALYFKEALDSLFNQKLQASEVVLVIDGPIGHALEGVCEHFSSKLKIIRLKENMGHGQARRVGIENCQYELVAIADADDLNDYKRFYTQVEFFSKNANASVVGGQMMEIVHDTKEAISQKNVPLKNDDINAYLKSRCPMNQATVMFKKSEVIEAGSYIDFFHNEDYYLWIRMYLNGAKFYNIDSVLVYVRTGREYFARRGGMDYFMSEYRIQKIMFSHKIISLPRFCLNVSIRFVIQLLLPNRLREFMFKKLFRKKVKNV